MQAIEKLPALKLEGLREARLRRENIESEYCLELKTLCSSFLFLFGSKIFQEVGSRDECYKDVLNVDRPLDSDVTGRTSLRPSVPGVKL